MSYGLRKQVWLVLGVGAPLACGDDGTVVGDGSSSSDATSSSGATSLESSSTMSESGTVDTSGTSASTSESSSSESSDGGASSSESSDGTTTAATTESSSSSAESSSSDSGVVPLHCPHGVLGPELPSILFGNTFAETDEFSGSCGGDGSPELGFLFTAPADGTYTFDTSGSQLDTVLYALDGECGGTELGCNDDGDGSQSALALDLTAGQTITLVVDGNSPDGNPFNLRVQQGSYVCPLDDIGSTVPNQVVADSSLAFNGSAGSCGGAGGHDASFIFTAPNTGTFTFDTFGAPFVSRIYVLDGSCGGAEIACGIEGVLANLTAGQQVTVVVDSAYGGGEFTLNIDTLGGVCPDVDLGNVIPQNVSDTTMGKDNTTSGSCGGEFSPDDLYEFTAPQDGLYQFDTFGSTLDTILYARQAGCGGPELECNDDWAPGETDSRVIEGMSAGQTVMIGVDGNGIGAYDLNVGLVPCPDEAIVGALPQSFDGSTIAGIDKLHGSCGSGLDDESPDYAYSFTAPAAGGYTFDTSGTFFDTRIYVLDGAACNGPEIACNDNYQFDWFSALSVQLEADQTVTVVVDGNFESEGNFTLNVGALSGVCPDEDLGNTVPVMVDGSTSGEDNASSGSCGGLTGNDYSYTFTAPADATYVFNTAGSGFDTAVYVRDGGCGGPELDCAFQPFGGGSLAFAALTEGQTVVVTVDGDGVEGDFTLVVDEAPDGGDCCIEHMETGCSNDEIEFCVCNTVGDSFCCMVQWDSLCVSEAIDDCGAACI